MPKSTRPDLRAYFTAQIDRHVNGMLARSTPSLPNTVLRVRGDVTDHVIVAVMRDGTEWRWHGGQYATKKRNGCYAPLMPKPTVTP